MVLKLVKSVFKIFICFILLFAFAVRPSQAGSIYDRPYSFTENDIDKERLTNTTLLLFGTGFVTMGILYLMPSSVTNWEDDGESPFRKWSKNVTDGPVWDKDDFFLNYVTHPYSGAIYYMGARSAGANGWYSFWYSFALSTFFWEYGIESFAEVPSIQDLIVTPVAGALLGEGFYIAKRHILKNDDKLLGSKVLGKTALLLMDPMTEISDWLWYDKQKPMNDTLTFNASPIYSSRSGVGYKLSLQFNF